MYRDGYLIKCGPSAYEVPVRVLLLSLICVAYVRVCANKLACVTMLLMAPTDNHVLRLW